MYINYQTWPWDPPCECPTFWWGVGRPPCPRHNPSSFTTTTTLKFPPEQQTRPDPLSDEDIARIAKAVAALLKKDE